MPRTKRDPHTAVLDDTQRGLAQMKGWLRYGRVGPPRGALNVAVCPGSIRRALALMRALMKAIAAEGGRATVEGKETVAHLDGERVAFTLREKVNEIATGGDYPKYEHAPTGVLQFEITTYVRRQVRRRWADSEKATLEERLPDFVAGLRKVAAARAEDQAEWAAEEAAQAEARARRQAEIEATQRERELRDALRQDAAAWHEAALIRRYVEARSAVGELDPAWVEWAMGAADQLDPLVG